MISDDIGIQGPLQVFIYYAKLSREVENNEGHASNWSLTMSANGLGSQTYFFNISLHDLDAGKKEPMKRLLQIWEFNIAMVVMTIITKTMCQQ